MEVKNKIILALDVLSMDQARKLLDEISDYLDTIKIGYPLVLAEGLEAVTQVKEEYNCKIITDFKVADIPATNQKIAEVTFQAGADAIIVHGFVGPDSVDSCVESAKKHGKRFSFLQKCHIPVHPPLQPVSMDIARMGVDMGIQTMLVLPLV